MVPGGTASAALGSGIWTSGAVTATSFNVSSKRELKDNISPFTATALDIINALDIVNFTYKSDEAKRPHVGIIADDTDPIISGPDQDTFDVSNTSGILIKAVQELSEKNSALVQTVTELKEQNSALEARLAAIEALLII